MTTAAMTRAFDAEPAGDAGVIQRIAQGDGGAFEQLVRLYQPRVTRLAHRLLGWDGSADVEDVVQDVFLTVLEKSRGFRGEASVWSWLTTITLNRCRSHARRALLKSRVMWLMGNRKRSEAAASHEVIGDELNRVVRSAVARLPRRDRELVVLVYLESRPAAEVAKLLGASRNTIDVRLYRARARLRKLLGKLVEV
jgi:RNA polymerase sigma factor (sigma-70 family)